MDTYVIVRRQADGAWQETRMSDGSRKVYETATEAQRTLDMCVMKDRRNEYRVKVLPEAWKKD